MRKEFDHELDKLSTELVKMANLVEIAITNMSDSFKHLDKQLAKEVINNDTLINDMERSVESKAFSIILKQQPIASDLRKVTSAIEIVRDLERMGDQAADICEMIINLEDPISYKTVEDIPTISSKTKIMAREAVNAFVKQDLALVNIVKKMDDEIDELFDEVKQEVIDILKENGSQADACIDYLMIAKYLEKIGDHAVNICEWIEFNLTGKVNDQRLI